MPATLTPPADVRSLAAFAAVAPGAPPASLAPRPPESAESARTAGTAGTAGGSAVSPQAAQAAGRAQDSFIPFHGRLPRAVVERLQRLPEHELRELYLVHGKDEEIRSLAIGARLLHLYFRQIPRAAASGRSSFVKGVQMRAELQADIARLRQKIQGAALDAGLLLGQLLETSKGAL